ncbi:MAG: M48 family metalloprotease [candidate division WS1 bacterium]|jgi:Zn-dependent protease with chaperone function|nr:M48 family metalloprotease [candidate division WS1 bacterium]
MPIILLTLFVALIGAPGYAVASDPPFSPEYEESVGREAAAQVEAEYTRYEDEEAQAKVDAMVAEIAAASTRPEIDYDVRLLDTDIVNAFSLPGGIIFVTKGLLEEVGSDHELAGVLAHEIAHNCTYDALEQAKRNEKLFTGSVAALIASILLGAPSDVVSTVMVAGEYVRRGVLGGYSIKMETAADQHAVDYLLATSYDPVGMLTFMERLAAEYRRKPQLQLGFLQTHPEAPDRVRDLSDYLNRSGVEINRRATTDWERPTAELHEPEEGEPYVRVVLWEVEIFKVLAAGPDHETAMARAEKIVCRLTGALEDGMRAFQLQQTEVGGNPVIGMQNRPILTIYPEDAEAYATDQRTLADEVDYALRRALFKEQLNRLY